MNFDPIQTYDLSLLGELVRRIRGRKRMEEGYIYIYISKIEELDLGNPENIHEKRPTRIGVKTVRHWELFSLDRNRSRRIELKKLKRGALRGRKQASKKEKHRAKQSYSQPAGWQRR